MINEINERIRNKEQFIENVERHHALASSAAISVKNVCLEEVDFMKELLQYVDALILEKDKEIADLKALISFERDINAGREDQLEQDIKHLRGVIDERGDLIVIAEQRKEIERLEKKLEATEQVLDALIMKCDRHACSGNKEGEKFFDPIEKQELIQKLLEIDDE